MKPRKLNTKSILYQDTSSYNGKWKKSQTETHWNENIAYQYFCSYKLAFDWWKRFSALCDGSLTTRLKWEDWKQAFVALNMYTCNYSWWLHSWLTPFADTYPEDEWLFQPFLNPRCIPNVHARWIVARTMFVHILLSIFWFSNVTIWGKGEHTYQYSSNWCYYQKTVYQARN